jgi:DNA-binding CsgD family transcriptional regulator
MAAPDGTVLGICGLEVNELLFKMQYRPDTSVFSDTTVMFAPVAKDGSLNTGAAMLSCTIPLQTNGVLAVSDYRHGLKAFESDGNRYIGLFEQVSLYSKNTVHSGEWCLAVLVPEAELTAYTAEKRRGITALLLVLLVCAIGLAVFLSKRYLAPVIKGLEQIKQGGAAGKAFKPTNVPEIDDLLDFLVEQDAAREIERQEMKRRLKRLGAEVKDEKTVPPSREDYEAFLKNLATLTKTERKVFDLYMQGHRAKDMPALLYRSMNTIKMHNRHIYEKLWISSREELLDYVKMMKEKGR